MNKTDFDVHTTIKDPNADADIMVSGNFSDHPASAWYGAWYISEVMDILTKNPEVWKKTIFILTYAGVALGRIPGLRLDRAGIALTGAALMMAIGAITPR